MTRRTGRIPLCQAAVGLLILTGYANGHQETGANDSPTMNNGQHSFWDVTSLDENKKLEMIVSSQYLSHIEDSIDWDGMRDNYLIASLSDDVGDQSDQDFVDDYEEDEQEEERLSGIKGRRKLPRKRRDHRRRKYRNKSGKKDKGKKENYYDYYPEPHTPPNTMPVAAPSIDPEQPSMPSVPTTPDEPTMLPDDDIAIRIPIYEYAKGNCPEDTPNGIPCAPDNLSDICDKYTDGSSFRECFEACKVSFCCIHDAPTSTNFLAPNCNTDPNCPGWAYCYIVWWKLHDTIGPAVKLQLEGNDDFFDVQAEEIDEDVTNNEFYENMLFHHFDDSNAVVERGTVQFNSTYAFFNSDLIFLDPLYWPDGDGL